MHLPRCLFLAVIAAAPLAGQTPLPTGGQLITTGNPITQFWMNPGSNDGPVISRSTVAVSGQPFSFAHRVNVLRPDGTFWNGSLGWFSNQPVADGDTILLRIWLRAAAPAGETGEAACTLYVEGPGPSFTKSLVRRVTVGSAWTEFLIPFPAVGSYAAGDYRLFVGFGENNLPQSLELAGMALFNYGTALAPGDLPATVPTYGGRDPAAPWRSAAADRIAAHRMADLRFRVVNADGTPLSGAEVEIEMERHTFEFGTAISAAQWVGGSPAAARYRDHFLELFNAGTLENALKWPPWVGNWGPSWRPNALNSLADLHRRGINLRGHVLVWPGYNNLPNHIRSLLDSGNTDPIPGLVAAHIDEITQATAAWVNEWDVVNEPFDNHDLMAIAANGGNQQMIDWFHRARANLPSAALYLNDYGILSGGGVNTAKQQHFEDSLRFLIDGGAPITGIGIQGHFGESLTPIPRLWEVLERYAQAFPGLDIRITEFDVDTADEQLQADYLRDFYTLLFSHPRVVGIQMWGFWEGRHWRPQAALFRQDWSAKPNAEAYRALVLDEWWTRGSGHTNASGEYQLRGYKGDYRVTLRHEGHERTFRFRLGETGADFDLPLTAFAASADAITVGPADFAPAQLHVHPPADRGHQLHASTDLIHWIPLGPRLPPGTEPYLHLIGEAASGDRLFFRLLLD
ncbi:MAG: energy transducer TonB [Puniceicoccaceae bacterium]|nr:MAG: energy transducer TonB [Puniceicoccaceae bacterium]